MNRYIARAGAVGFLLLLVAAPVLAFVPRAGDTVTVTEAIADDLYVAGGTVRVTGDVDGDIVAAGGTVSVESQTTGGVLAAGGTLQIGGRIDRSLRAAGGTVGVAAAVKRDGVLAGGTIMVESAAHIGRDLVAAGGTVQVTGAVDRNAMLYGGSVILAGPVQGNVEVQADRLVVLSTARIGGRLRYATSRPAEIQSGAQVAGGTEEIRVTRPRAAPGFRGRSSWLWRIGEGTWLLVLGLVTFAFLPAVSRRIVGEVRTRFGWSLLIGFVLVAVIPVAIALLLVTVVGIPLSGILFLLCALTLYPAQMFVSAWLGDTILRAAQRASGRTPSMYWALIAGTIALVILFAVPLVGWVVRLVAVLGGFGALWATVWRAAASTRLSTPAAAT